MFDSAEVVVIGGGVIGTSIAYYLAREGVDVALVECGDLASGTSSQANGGVVTGAEPLSPLITYSNDLFKSLAEELSIDFQYRREGSYRLIETEADWDMMSGITAKQSARHLPVKLISERELHNRESNIASDIMGAVEYPLDATLNPILYCWTLAHKACQLGVRIHTFTKVSSIEVGNQRQVKSVCTSNGDIVTKNVVNAAGCWAPFIGEMVGINIPIIPRRGQIVVTEATGSIVNKKKLNETGILRTRLQMEMPGAEREQELLGVGFVYEHTIDGNILLGSSREFVGFNTRTTPEVICAIARRAIRFVPELKRLNCIRSFAGLRPFTSDHLPIISATEEVEGFYIASGHEGTGVGLAPLTGKVISELIIGKKPCVNLEQFSFSRFKSGQPKVSQTNL